MDGITILIALSLAIDSFSVSITRGLANPQTKMFSEALKIGGFFGFFQALMPFIGWLIGITVIDLIAAVDHWIAFGLLIVIGLRMIYESIKPMSKKIVHSSSISVLLMLSIATSIDALAVGLSYSLIKASIVIPAATIGIVTFILSFIGAYLGKRFGRIVEKIGIIGGFILISIGIKILLEHIGN